MTRRPAWELLAALLALGALATWWLPESAQQALEWRPALAAEQPWRAWSAAWRHWSLQHLLANLAGCAVLAWLGRRAGLGGRAALAWLAAWPLTQAALVLAPALQRFGGLSGVLHAGVAVAALELLARPGRPRLVELGLAAGLALKLALERGWAAPWLREAPGWDIAVAPLAHLSGAVAGAACTLILMLVGAWLAPRGRRRHGASLSSRP